MAETKAKQQQAHTHDHNHDHGQGGHDSTGATFIKKEWMAPIASFVLLVVGLVMDYWLKPAWFADYVRLLWYTVAYVPVGLPVLSKGVKLALKGEFFTEFTLMGIATIGAFCIGEYPEGVAVMLFYAVGELFQDAAVASAKRNIRALLDVRPDTASVQRGESYQRVHPSDVAVGEIIQVKAGDRVPLDGLLISEEAYFNTSALTGESAPATIIRDGTVLAGMINESKVIEMRVSKPFDQSSLSRILTLVQNAQGRKARTELFIRRFARIYTPIVFFLAVGLVVVPYFFVDDYVFAEWFYRALIFLVISCPCALVVAIPLGYFGGIGAASRNGILFKGSTYLDAITTVRTVVMDKTGTLTEGTFKVSKVVSHQPSSNDWVPLVAAVEGHSSHPVAKAIYGYAQVAGVTVSDVEEKKGFGITGVANGRKVVAGNARMMKSASITIPAVQQSGSEAIIFAAIDGAYAGHIFISDKIKEDAPHAIAAMKQRAIRVAMLSGDSQSVVDDVARKLGINEAYGDLLPEQKVEKLNEIKASTRDRVAFVGDGINDAPVLALSDVGIAMGGLGADAAIETADVVIQTDQPSKILTAIEIGKATNAIVWQNIGLAFFVKVIVMVLGAVGVSSMWEAVFADVGVALLAILNAIRIQRMKFRV